jgi:hypothetical protein
VAYSLVSSSAVMVSPVHVVVAPISSTTAWWLVSGRPRQLRVICANSRCSTLFHLEVPGRRQGP